MVSVVRWWILLLSLLLPLTATALEIMVLPGEAERVERVWRTQPAEVEPSLYPLQRVYPEQPFQVLVLARDYQRNSDDKAAVEYTLQIFGPDGRSVEGPLAGLDLYHGAAPEKGALLLSQQHLTLTFSDSDPSGRYTFNVSAVDTVDNSRAEAKASVQLAALDEAVDFGSREAFSEWMSNYYRNPDPGRVFAAVRQYVATDDKGRLAGAPLRLFLARVLADNPFLRHRFQQLYAQADDEGREKLLLVLAADRAALAGWAEDLDDRDRKVFAQAQHLVLPDLNLPPASIPEINAQWGQFYASGDIEPLRQLVAGMALQTYRGVQEKIAAGVLKETAEVKAKAAMEDIYKALLWSLVTHGNQHSRVEKYLQVIADEKHLDAAVQDELEQVLQIIEKERLEKEAEKKLEEKGKASP